MSDEKEWDMSLELNPTVIINRHVALNEKLTAERDALNDKLGMWFKVLEKTQAERDALKAENEQHVNKVRVEIVRRTNAETERDHLKEMLENRQKRMSVYRELVERATYIVGCVTDGSAVNRWLTAAKAALGETK